MLTVFIFFTAFEKPHENSELKYFYYKIHKTRQKTKVSIALEASNFIFRYSQKNGNRAPSIQNLLAQKSQKAAILIKVILL